MAVRRRDGGDFTGQMLPGFPYPYASDLHCLWGWGQRIQANLDSEDFAPSEHDWIFHRADARAADAMLRFSIDYPAVIDELRRCQRNAESRWEEFLDRPVEDTRLAYLCTLEILHRQIWVACEAIAERQSAGAAGQQQPDDPDSFATPDWDSDTGILTYRGENIREVKRRARNVRAVLDAFQEEDWPKRIDDPLPNGRDASRVNDTVKTLNSDLRLIRFRADGSGAGFQWEPVA